MNFFYVIICFKIKRDIKKNIHTILKLDNVRAAAMIMKFIGVIVINLFKEIKILNSSFIHHYQDLSSEFSACKSTKCSLSIFICPS